MNALKQSRRRWIAGTAAAAAAATLILMSAAGPAAAAPAPEVFSGFKDSTAMVGNVGRSGALQLPIGTYAITAKVYATNNNGVTNTVNCRLDGVTSFDISEATLTSSVTNQTLSFDMVNIANNPRLIFLSCRNSNFNANTTLKFMKITATRVNDPN
ncbi:MAG: hypothetical protein ACREYC_15020, partial [Gammaproteobacteria bacterium]